MKNAIKAILACMWCVGILAVAGCEVDLVDAHGYHHHGHYDADHHWHGGYTDADNHYHDDPADWHK